MKNLQKEQRNTSIAKHFTTTCLSADSFCWSSFTFASTIAVSGSSTLFNPSAPSTSTAPAMPISRSSISSSLSISTVHVLKSFTPSALSATFVPMFGSSAPFSPSTPIVHVFRSSILSALSVLIVPVSWFSVLFIPSAPIVPIAKSSVLSALSVPSALFVLFLHISNPGRRKLVELNKRKMRATSEELALIFTC